MFIAALATIILFLIFMIIGFGPSLLLISSRKCFEISLAIAPAVGLVITTLIGTYLVLLDYPINVWAFPWLIIGILSSFVMSLIAFKIKKIIPVEVVQKNILLFLSGLLITILLLIIPMVIGGLNFTVLRGNGTDTFNYLAMAGYLMHEPYSWIHHASTQALIDKHPSYFIVRQLFSETRWSTSMILGWCTSITHVPLYRLEYGFTTLFFMMTYCCTYWYATRMNIKPQLALLVAIAISAGFWGQFVLDIRAMSQISALPLIVLLAFLLDAEDKENLLMGKLFLIGIALTAIVFLYVEITPLIALGLLFFLTIKIFQKKYRLSIFTKSSLILTVTFFTTLPAFSYLERILQAQMSMALNMKVTWDDAYFHWLYHHIPTGFWGFSYLGEKIIPRHGIIAAIFSVIFILISIVLTITLFYILWCMIFKKNNHLPFKPTYSLALALAAFTIFIYLVLRDQLWAAGKGLSYSYPFWMLIIALALSNFWQIQQYSKFKQVLMFIGKYTVLLWFILQCTLGIQRIAYAGLGRDYHNYILNHGDYRRYDWNFDEFIEFLTKTKANSVGIRVTDNWLTEYLGLVLGWDFHVVYVNGVFDRDGTLLGKQDMSSPPEYIITQQDDARQKQSQVLVKNKEFVLIKNSNK